MSPGRRDDGWHGYVARFHHEEPGITEELLGRTAHDGLDPYAWCAAAVTDRPGPVLDLACGNGPLAPTLGRAAGGPGWIGLDSSRAELAAAQAAGRPVLIRASATRLPVADGAAAAVACSMGLQVVEPLEAALAELGRVLAPGGRAALLLPANRPLGLGDAWAYLRVQVALRAVIRYPNGPELAPRRLATGADAHGLTVTSDQSRAFALPLRDRATCELLVRSLYLPATPPARRARAVEALVRRIGRDIAIPLRRVVLDRT